jgi:hypothetical protein
MRVSSMVAYWTRTHVVMGSKLSEVKFNFVSCSRHVVVPTNTRNYCTKDVHLLKIYYHTSLYDLILSGASADPTSQVRSSAMLVLGN